METYRPDGHASNSLHPILHPPPGLFAGPFLPSLCRARNWQNPSPGVPAQRFLDISEIREDVVVMKDGTLRAVLLVSGIGTALKIVGRIAS